MKREDIEKAALLYVSQSNLDDYAEAIDVRNAFVDGAKWRIDSVWHEASEQPKYDKTVLKHCLLDGDDAYKTSRNDNIMEKRSWDYWVVEDGLIEWAYIEDLIPTNE